MGLLSSTGGCMLPISLGVLAGTLVLFVLIGQVHDLVWRARRRRFRAAAVLLSRVMFGTETDAEEAVRELSGMPRGLLIRSLQSLTSDVGGESRDRLNRLVIAVGMRSTVTRRLRRGMPWRRRAQGAQLCQLLPPGDALRRQALADPHPVVRARALEGMQADEVAEDAELVTGLLRDPSPMVRAAAQRAVLAADERVVPHVIRELASKDRADIVVPALLAVAASLPDPRLVPAVGEHAVSADPARRALVAEALGAMRSPRAAPVLTGLLNDEEPRVRAAAATGVGTTGAVELAGRLGVLLGDPAWDVRRAAATGLAELGPSGWMVLRAAMRSHSTDAAEIARQMLDQLATSGRGARALTPERLLAFGEDLALRTGTR
ncbi:MAG: HEAT repeat domain-containing protein [Thermoleophilia bacterium]